MAKGYAPMAGMNARIGRRKAEPASGGSPLAAAMEEKAAEKSGPVKVPKKTGKIGMRISG